MSARATSAPCSSGWLPAIPSPCAPRPIPLSDWRRLSRFRKRPVVPRDLRHAIRGYRSPKLDAAERYTLPA